MAPKFPDEVNVFLVPHSRMKDLVGTYMDQVHFRYFHHDLLFLLIVCLSRSQKQIFVVMELQFLQNINANQAQNLYYHVRF